MKLATWNVNSIRIRIDRLIALLARHTPDIVCLQEIKLVDEAFPYDAVHAAGYRYVTLDLEGLRSGNLNGAEGGPRRDPS